MFQRETLRDRLQVEGGHHHAPQDHPQEEVGEEAGEAVEVEEVVEEHSHYPDTPRNPLKSF